MKSAHPKERGFGFGLTSGVITTLGLIIGLYTSTEQIAVVIAGIVSIAVADAFSDALGMHISEEASRGTKKSIWKVTAYTFASKLLIASSFAIPVFLLDHIHAVIVCIIYGLSLILAYSYFISVKQGKKPYVAMVEHTLIACAVIVITYIIGALLKGFK